MHDYTVPLTCPSCGDELEHEADGACDGQRACALAGCPSCGAGFRVNVTVEQVRAPRPALKQPRGERGGRRWSAAELLDAAGVSALVAAEVLGVRPRSVHRAVVDGLNEPTADRWACRMGFHPAVVWPEWSAEG